MRRKSLLPELPGPLAWNTNNLISGGLLQVVPEPSTSLLLGLGLAGLAVRGRESGDRPGTKYPGGCGESTE